jgi:uncharacterized membrane protein
MSQIYLSGIIALLAQVLPHIGVTLGNDELTSFITTGVTILSALWVLVRRYKQGDITIVGGRKG